VVYHVSEGTAHEWLTWRRALNYRNLFKDSTLFFHPRDVNEHFLPGVDYKVPWKQEVRESYGENNAWIYSFNDV
jgi:putative alpha-1,2-mannosidase